MEDSFEVTTDEGETVVGPVTLDQVRRGLAAGKIPATAQIRNKGGETWHPVLASLAWEASTASKHEPPSPSPAVPIDSRVSNWMDLADAAQRAGNHEEAYRLFTQVLETDSRNAEAWFGKATAAGWHTNLRHDRYPELIQGMENAVRFASAVPEMKRRAAKVINTVTVTYFALSKQHTMEFISLDGTWEEHVQRCISMLRALQAAHAFDATNQQLLKNGIDLAKTMLDGVWFEHEFEEGRVETTSVPPELEKYAVRVRDEFVGALQKLDPNFKAEKIEKVGGVTATGCVGCIVVLLILGGAGWWLVRSFLDQPSSSTAGTAEPSKGEAPPVALATSTSPAIATSSASSAPKTAAPRKPIGSAMTKPKPACDPNCFYNFRCMVMSDGASAAPCCPSVTKVMDGLPPEHLANCRGGAIDLGGPGAH